MLWLWFLYIKLLVYWKSLVNLEVLGPATVFSHVFYMQSACKRLTILYSQC